MAGPAKALALGLVLTYTGQVGSGQRFAFGTIAVPGDIQSVGGRDETLAITPSELIWVNRKTLSSQ
jgi:hypothetical protein